MIDQEGIDAAREGNLVEAAGWAALKGFYTVATVGFAVVHDPVRDAYDHGEVSTSEYATYGIGAGLAVAGVTLATGGMAATAAAGASTALAVGITAGAGVLEGAAVDAITQLAHLGAGVQNDYNATQTLTAGIFGGALGGVGGALGAAMPRIGRGLRQAAEGLATSRPALAVRTRATQLRAQAAEALSNVAPGLTTQVRNGGRAMRGTIADARASMGQLAEQAAQVRASASAAMRQKTRQMAGNGLSALAERLPSSVPIPLPVGAGGIGVGRVRPQQIVQNVAERVRNGAPPVRFDAHVRAREGLPVFRQSLSDPATSDSATAWKRALDTGSHPDVLQRAPDRSSIRRNRRRSQRAMRREAGRPRRGYNYDEYPPASTVQGGSSAYVEEVLAGPNQELGRRLGTFFTENDIPRGGWFRVEFTD